MDRLRPFFRAGGTMEPNAPSYIERRADDRLLEALLDGEYVFLLDSRQKGKSSLVSRAILGLRSAGVATVKLDLQRIGSNVTPEQWYAGLLSGIGEELELRSELFDYWGERQPVGPLARWVGALVDVVLAKVDQPIVIFVDEVDFVRALPFATDEFFAAVRECFNRRSGNPLFNRLTFCLIGVATAGQLIRNPDISPFNIGSRIELSDFTLEETHAYSAILENGSGNGNRKRNGLELLARVHRWVHGHPYLTQLLCTHVVTNPEIRTAQDIDRLVRDLFFTPESRQREPNLADVERRMLQPDVPGLSAEEGRVQVLDLYGRILRGKNVEASEENPVVATLRLSGVGVEVDGNLRVRNRVYEQVFDESWRIQNLPEAEVRRQQSASRLATLRTMGIAGIVVLAVSAAAVGFLQVSNERQRALTDLQVQTKAIKRISEERQEALTKLQHRTEELKRVSDERGRVLKRLEQQNQLLKKVSGERAVAITDLEARSVELKRQSYREQIAIINAESSLSHWAKVTAAVDRSAQSPYRQWEWGYAARVVNQDARRERFPKWSVIETQTNGGLMVATPSVLFDIGKAPPTRIRALEPGTGNTPRYRVGDLRVQMVEAKRSDSIRDERTGKLLVGPKRYAVAMDIDPIRRLYLLARDETLETLELRTVDGDRLIVAYKAPNHTDAARFLPDGTILSIHTTTTEGLGDVRHWDRTGATLDTAPSDQHYAHGLALSADGAMYAAWGYNGNVEVRRVKQHRKVSTLTAHPKTVTHLVFSRSGAEILTGSDDGMVRVFDVKSGRLLRRWVGHQHPIYQVAFLPSGGGYASIDSEGNLRVWEEKTQRSLEEYSTHTKMVTSATLDPAGTVLVSAAIDGTLASRDLATDRLISRPVDLLGESQAPRVARATVKDAVFVGRRDGGVDRLVSKTLKLTGSVKVFDSPVESLEAIEGGRRLFVGYANKKFAVLDGSTLKVWARIEPTLIRKPIDPTGVDVGDCFAIDPERPQVAIFLGGIGKIQVYSTLDGHLIKSWNPGQTVLSMAFSSRGTQLVASLSSAWWMRNGRTVVYNPQSGAAIGEFKHPGRAIRGLVYAPKTQIMAGCSSERMESERVGILWNMKTLGQISELATGDGIWELAFSPDGERLLSNSIADGTMRIWNSRTGEECLSMRYPGTPSIGWAAKGRFSPDGRRIIQKTVNGWVRIFNTLPWK